MRETVKDTASFIDYVVLVDSTTGLPKTGLVYTDITGSYVRAGGSRTAITMATLAAANSAYSSGGFKEVDATNQPGLYRIDWPDAMFATGVDKVVGSLKGTGVKTEHKEFFLTAWNKQIASIPNVASAASGGLLTRGTGDGQINALSGVVDANIEKIIDTAPTEGAAGRLAAAFSTLFNVAVPVFTAASVNQTGDSFARIGANGAGLSNVILPAGGLANVTAWTVAITGDITGSLSGSVGSVTGNVGGSVGSVTGAVGSITGVTFPSNFGLFSIDGSGRVLLQPTQTGVTIPTVTTLTDAPADSAGVTQLVTDYTTGRAANLDNLNATITSRLAAVSYTAPDNTGIAAAEAAAIAAAADAASLEARVPASPAAVGSAMTLEAGERNAIATALLDLADGVETSVTVRKALRAMASILAGTVTGAGTDVETFKAIGNSGTTRVVSGADVDGNRSPTLSL